MPDLSIIVPIYNEAGTAEAALRRILGTAFSVDDVEVIVIDDGSADGTSELLSRTDWPGVVNVLRHARNHGKGAAIRTGLRNARGTYTTILDADLEYDPADTARLLKPLLRGDADAVFGVRGFEAHSAYSFWYVIGNKAVTLATNLLYNSWISDLMTGQKASRTALLRSLPLQERGFAIEAEITARLLRARKTIYEVPVTYRARSRSEGKKLRALDGVRVLGTLLRCRFS